MIFLFQDFAIASSFTLFLSLILMPYRGASQLYKRSRRLLSYALLAFMLQFVMQRVGQFRLNSDDSLALLVNVLFFMPVIFLIFEASLLLLTNGKVPKRYRLATYVCYPAAIALALLNCCLSSAELSLAEFAEHACCVVFMSHLLVSYTVTYKVYQRLRRRLDNYYDFDAIRLVYFMRYAAISAMSIAVFSPFVLFIGNHLAICILNAAICLVLIYFTMRFVDYEHVMDKIWIANTHAESDVPDAEDADAAMTGEERDADGGKGSVADGSEAAAQRSYDYAEKLSKWVGERKHLQQNLTIMQLAKEIGTNQKYLSRYFNEVLDTTFRDWLNGLRMVDAKRMLADEDNKTIEAIAFECGFSSRTHFHSLFVKRFGKTPLQYKSECQRQKNNEGSGITPPQQRLRE